MPDHEPVVTITERTVSCLPLNHRDRRHFEIRVRARRDGWWIVTDGFDYYDSDGTAVGEPFAMDGGIALDLAKRLAPVMTVNGMTVEQALARGGAR